MGTNRIEAFSDGVIAIILTVMVLELKIPASATLPALKAVLPTLLSYALSFLIIAIMWVNHHHMMHLAKHPTAVLLWANNNLLFWMSLIPFVTAFMGQTHGTPLAVAACRRRLRTRADPRNCGFHTAADRHLARSSRSHHRSRPGTKPPLSAQEYLVEPTLRRVCAFGFCSHLVVVFYFSFDSGHLLLAGADD